MSKLVSGLFGGDAGEEKTKQATTLPAASESEKKLEQLSSQLAIQQLQRLLDEGTLFDESIPVEQQVQQFQQQFEQATRAGTAAAELTQIELERARRGGIAGPEQRAEIEKAIQESFNIGRSEIERFAAKSLEQVREELSPRLGLRPTDTPITDRGLRIGEEAVRQFGQLQSSLRGQGIQAALDPTSSALNLKFAESSRAFQSNLRNQAFINRLNLTEAPGTLSAFRNLRINQPTIRQTFTQAPIDVATKQATLGAGIIAAF